MGAGPFRASPRPVGGWRLAGRPRPLRRHCHRGGSRSCRDHQATGGVLRAPRLAWYPVSQPVSCRDSQRRSPGHPGCEAWRCRLYERRLCGGIPGPRSTHRGGCPHGPSVLGLGAMDAFVKRAHEAGSCLPVVTRSSNPEGRTVQASVDGSGRSVETALLEEIGALNTALAPGEVGPVGAVVGPTHTQPTLDLRAAHALFLAPGVGAQGATPMDVARVFASCTDRVMPSASRSVLQAGPDVSQLRDQLEQLAAEFRLLLPA